MMDWGGRLDLKLWSLCFGWELRWVRWCFFCSLLCTCDEQNSWERSKFLFDNAAMAGFTWTVHCYYSFEYSNHTVLLATNPSLWDRTHFQEFLEVQSIVGNLGVSSYTPILPNPLIQAMLCVSGHQCHIYRGLVAVIHPTLSFTPTSAPSQLGRKFYT